MSPIPTLCNHHISHLRLLYLSSGHSKGVMVPPVCIDLNNDNVGDIVMSAFDGTVTAYDGETLQQLWSNSFGKQESYRLAIVKYPPCAMQLYIPF